MLPFGCDSSNSTPSVALGDPIPFAVVGNAPLVEAFPVGTEERGAGKLGGAVFRPAPPLQHLALQSEESMFPK